MAGGKVVSISDSDFDASVVGAATPALVDFWAEWCQPCKMLAPTVEELADEYHGRLIVGKVNVDDNPSTATKFGIRGIPTLLLFKNGKVVQKLVGVKSKNEIKKIIEDNL